MLFDWLKNWWAPPIAPSKSGNFGTTRGVPVAQTTAGKLYKELQVHCPDCDKRPAVWMQGPSGGMSTNIFCNGCGAGYNVTPVVEIAEPIHRDIGYITGVTVYAKREK